jgi:hypothetical protein
MLELARRADWEQVEELERARKSFAVHDLIGEVLPQDYRQIQTRLEKIIDLDNQILTLARARYAELGEQLGHLNRGRKARQAYQRST